MSILHITTRWGTRHPPHLGVELNVKVLPFKRELRSFKVLYISISKVPSKSTMIDPIHHGSGGELSLIISVVPIIIRNQMLREGRSIQWNSRSKEKKIRGQVSVLIRRGTV